MAKGSPMNRECKVGDIAVQTAINTVQLAEHMKRSDTNEQHTKILSDKHDLLKEYIDVQKEELQKEISVESDFRKKVMFGVKLAASAGGLGRRPS